MHADNARSGQLTGSLLLHGVLYNTQRSAHDGQRLRAQGKQHLGYAAAQHRRKKIGKWVRDLLGIKALPAVAMQIHKTGGKNIHCKISRAAAGNGSDPTIFDGYSFIRQECAPGQKPFCKNFHGR